MSFQPPPPPAGPVGQPTFGLQQGPPPGSESSGKRSPLPWIIGAVVLVIVIAVVVVIATSGGGGGSGVNASGASEGLSVVLDDAEFDDTGFAQLRRCPFGDPADLTEQIADDIGASDDLFDGDTDQYVLEESGSVPQAVVCSIVTDASTGRSPDAVYFSALTLPRGGYEKFLENSYGDGGEVEIEEPTSFKGGQIYGYCTTIDGEDTGCGADWVHEDEKLIIGLSVGPSRVTAADAEAAVRTVVSTMADGLADQS